MSFSNPVPVAVAIVPYKNKLIGIRRGIEPRKGQIAFPGGNRLLVFGLFKGSIDGVDFNFKTEETQEVLLIDSDTQLAFPLHEDARNKFISSVNSSLSR